MGALEVFQNPARIHPVPKVPSYFFSSRSFWTWTGEEEGGKQILLEEWAPILLLPAANPNHPSREIEVLEYEGAVAGEICRAWVFYRVKTHGFLVRVTSLTLFLYFWTRVHTLSLCFSCSRRIYVHIRCTSKLKLDFYPLLFPFSLCPCAILAGK